MNIASVLTLSLLIQIPKISVNVMKTGVIQLRVTTVFFLLLKMHSDRLAGIFVAILSDNERNLP